MSDFSTARQNMVDGQIRPSNVTDWRIIDAMRAVPREAFVPDAQAARWPISTSISTSAGRRGQALPDQAGRHGEAAAGRRDRARRQRPGGRLRHRLCRRAGGQAGRARHRDRERRHRWRRRPGDPRRSWALAMSTVRTRRGRRGRSGRRRRTTSSSSTAPPRSCPTTLYEQLRDRRPAGRRLRDGRAAAGHRRDPLAWRFRQPGAVRCLGSGAARAWSVPGLRFLAVPALAADFRCRNQKCGPDAPPEEFRRGNARRGSVRRCAGGLMVRWDLLGRSRLGAREELCRLVGRTNGLDCLGWVG